MAPGGEKGDTNTQRAAQIRFRKPQRAAWNGSGTGSLVRAAGYANYVGEARKEKRKRQRATEYVFPSPRASLTRKKA